MRRSYFLVIISFFVIPYLSAQLDTSIHIGFYNVENLFDTIDNPETHDEFYTPESRLSWDSKKYRTKISRISEVIEWMNYPAIMGLAEVENRKVIQDLISHPRLSSLPYNIIHYETKDHRGIDCALLFRNDILQLDTSFLWPISISDTSYTGRELLIAEGTIRALPIRIVVNHWPSRSGGIANTKERRKEVAEQLRPYLRQKEQEEAHIILMGDFNDEPWDESLLHYLGADTMLTSSTDWFNTGIRLHKLDKGTYNYRGNWNILDQIIVSRAFLDCSDSFCFRKIEVLDRTEILFTHPRFGDMPNRTAGGPNYYGGYSDHLPIMAEFRIPSSVE